MMINNFLVRKKIGKNFLEKKKPAFNRLYLLPNLSRNFGRTRDLLINPGHPGL